MFKLKYIKFVIFSMWVLLASAQPATIKNISSAMASGNADILGKYFAEQIHINLNEKENLYPKLQGVEIMRRFFNQVSPKDFNIRHNTEKADRTAFQIGVLHTGKGRFRVTYFLKNDKKEPKIRRLKIERIQNKIR